MDYQSMFNKDAGDPQSSGSTEKLITQAGQSLKLQDRFRLERPSLSYADFHHEITKNAGDHAPKFSVNCQKMEKKKLGEDDELVKYMSNLPSYLQRGETPQEKALNIGVLNWGRLENWQHNLKQAPQRNSACSPSSSNTSSFFSNDGSSTNHSGSDQSCSPSCQKMQRSTLQSHLQGSSQGAKSFGGNSRDLEPPQTEILNQLQLKSKMDEPSHRSNSVVMLDGSMKKDSNLAIALKRGSSSYLQNYEAASCSDGLVKDSNDKFVKEADKSESFMNCDIFDRQSRVVLLLPRDTSQTSSSVVTQTSVSTAIKGNTLAEANRRNSTENFTSTAVHSREFHPNNSLSCEYACEAVNNDNEHVQHHSMGDKSDESSSGASLPASSVQAMTSPPKSRKPKGKSTWLPIDSTAINPPQEFDQKANRVPASKVKYPSPTRRLFSIGMSRISRRLASKEDPDVKNPSPCPTHLPAESDNERNANSECSSGNQNSIKRTKSSPLRRLLDPLLKPKVSADSRQSFAKCGSSDGQLEHSAVHYGKVKLDYKRKEKGGPQTVQALLQVATKNGLPLFTFAVDNNKKVLAATVKNLSFPIKNDYSCLFTFFTIHGAKKKMWKNQGGKGDDYIPNVIAQMKVSDYQSKERFKMREFVLFGVELRHENKQNSEFQPNDELAAIVMKIPNETTASVTEDRRESDNYCKSSSKKDQHYHTAAGSEDHYTAKIILPSGIHSVSRKGEPTSLIERWISGGLCDCGGWDLGCKLRVLGDGNQLDERSSLSTKCLTTEQFNLYDQEGVQENQPVFSLAPFRDGIYSVVFNSSLSHVQAFSICISAFEGGKLSELSNSKSKELLQEKSSKETTSPLENDGMKIRKGMDAEAPMKYVSYPPPLSPVGRV